MKPTHVVDSKINYQLLSTTTTLGRVRGFTLHILYYLGDGPRRCCELVEITGKSHAYVHRYLRNMRIYGLVEKKGVYWNLTLLGVEFLKYLRVVYNNILEYGKKEERKKKEYGKNIERLNLTTQDTEQKETVKKPVSLKQVRIDLWSKSTPLEQAEKEVVEVLLKHYNETGVKYLYFKDHYEIAERFNINPNEVNQVLMNLKQDGIIYTYKDRNHNAWKIGLKKAFIETLKINFIQN